MSAYIAAAVKAKVTLIEAHKMGGDCLNYGCVPSKALIKSAKLASQMRHGEKYGLSDTTPTFSFKTVMQRIHAVIAAIEPHDSVERYTGLGVEVLQGYAKLVNPWTVEIALNDGGTQRLTARSIVIAAGARPFVPPLPGLEDVGYVTSDTLWDEFAQLDEVPKRLVVLGGGPIGSELAQSFARLGSAVTQVEMGPRIMAREDEEVSELAKQALMADGVDVRVGHKALRCEMIDGEKTLIVEHQGQSSASRLTSCCAPWAAAPASPAMAWKTSASPPTAWWKPTNTWKRCTPTSSPPATWPGPTSSPTWPPTRPGTPRSTPCLATSRNSRPTTR